MTAREPRLACGHLRFCEACIRHLEHIGSAWPICRADITIVLRLFWNCSSWRDWLMAFRTACIDFDFNEQLLCLTASCLIWDVAFEWYLCWLIDCFVAPSPLAAVRSAPSQRVAAAAALFEVSGVQIELDFNIEIVDYRDYFWRAVAAMPVKNSNFTSSSVLLHRLLNSNL